MRYQRVMRGAQSRTYEPVGAWRPPKATIWRNTLRTWAEVTVLGGAAAGLLGGVFFHFYVVMYVFIIHTIITL